MKALLLVVFSAFTISAAADTPWYSPYDAKNLIGETVWVCGNIGSARYARSVRGEPTYINLGPAYPEQVFTIVIWGSDREKFEQEPERMTGGVCVRGQVGKHAGIPQIIVRDPQQIRQLRD